MPYKIITSPTNDNVKAVVRLRDKKERDRCRLTIIEGEREVLSAIKNDVELKEIYFCPDFLRKHLNLNFERLSYGCEVFEVSKAVFEKMAYGDRLEGVLAVGKPKILKLSEIKLAKCPFFAVIEKVEKPGNLGAILRSCDGVGVNYVIVCDPATDVFNPNVIRSSIGTIFSQNIVLGSSQQVLEFLKKNNVKIFAATPQAQENYYNADFKNPLAILLGSEKDGLSDFWLNGADSQIKIPMRGNADSLNVSTTAAILFYEVLRQRESS